MCIEDTSHENEKKNLKQQYKNTGLRDLRAILRGVLQDMEILIIHLSLP